MLAMPIVIRPAELGDDAALTKIDQETWDPRVTPGPLFSRPFFDDAKLEEVTVALHDDQVVGYIRLRPASALPANAHVLLIAGLGVAPSAQRRGVASRLLEAAEAHASQRNIERLTLRVLSVNTAALALYERHGYRIEGELRGEFRLPVGEGGAIVPVDDVLMAKTIVPRQG